jgi:glycosyltransferase involved in cell wall biosynthesis
VTRVSVITPFLNAEAHLAEAVASVGAQTFADWELLLVDDCSTDGSAALAAALGDAEARVRVLRLPGTIPHGPAAARNAGIAAARGDFLAFLDADDLLEPHMLATTLAAIERHRGAALVFGPTLWWHPDDPGRDWLEDTGRHGGRLHRPPDLLRSLVLLQRGHVPCICSVLVRRSAAEAVGGFEERLRLYEDQTLLARLLARFEAFVVPVCLARYRQHAGSASARAAAGGEYDRWAPHPARAAFLAWLEEDLSASGTLDPALARTLRVVRTPYCRDRGLRARLDRLEFAAHVARPRLRRWLKRGMRRALAGPGGAERHGA